MKALSLENLIEAALAEDLGQAGDITTLAIGSGKKKVRAEIIAKQQGIMCGGQAGKRVFETVDDSIAVSLLAEDGEELLKGKTVMEIEGPSASILTAERTALNFLGRLCGVATATNRFVKAIEGLPTRILDTRKTTPGWRELEKQAVRCGGGSNHRTGLFDMFLIKENHIAAAGGITPAVNGCIEYMKKKNINAEIEVETRTIEEVKEAMYLPVDRIMLDNMSLELMKECVKLVNHRIPLEASGNVRLENVREIAKTGVDFISVGAITHSAPNFDLSLLILV